MRSLRLRTTGTRHSTRGQRGYLEGAALLASRTVFFDGWLAGTLAPEVPVADVEELPVRIRLEPWEILRSRLSLFLTAPTPPSYRFLLEVETVRSLSTCSRLGPLGLELGGRWYDIPGSHQVRPEWLPDAQLDRLRANLSPDATNHARGLLVGSITEALRCGDPVAEESLRFLQRLDQQPAPPVAPAPTIEIEQFALLGSGLGTLSGTCRGARPSLAIRAAACDPVPLDGVTRWRRSHDEEHLESFVSTFQLAMPWSARRDVAVLEALWPAGEPSYVALNNQAVEGFAEPRANQSSGERLRIAFERPPDVGIVVAGADPWSLEALFASLGSAPAPLRRRLGVVVVAESSASGASELISDLSRLFAVDAALLPLAGPEPPAVALHRAAVELRCRWLFFALRVLFKDGGSVVAKLLDRASRTAGPMVVAPRIVQADDHNAIERAVHEATPFDSAGAATGLPEVSPSARLENLCFLVERQLYLSLGGFARLYSDVGLEAFDFALRLGILGGEVYSAPERCLRLGAKNGLESGELAAADLTLFEARWKQRLQELERWHRTVSKSSIESLSTEKRRTA
ncbi:MAG: hypothetical protein AAGC60_02325 [Acidobacteriota bacterium]